MAKRKPGPKGGKKAESSAAIPGHIDLEQLQRELSNAILTGGPVPPELLGALQEIFPNGLMDLGAGEEFGVPDFDDDDFPQEVMPVRNLVKQRASLDKKLLRSPDNPQLLADRASLCESVDEAIPYLERAVGAAEKKLGNLKKFEGHYWQDLRSRKYMQMREKLAKALVEAERMEDGIVVFRELLALDPEDHQGNRYQLLKHYVHRQNWSAAGEIIALFPDDEMADFRYTAVLIAFQRSGDSEPSRKLLKSAMDFNPHVVNELLCQPGEESEEDEELDAEMHGHMVIGGASEARDHAQGFRSFWRVTPGAISWLRMASHMIRQELELSAPKKKKPSTAAVTKEIKATLSRIRDLPQIEEEWVIDVIGMDSQGSWGLLVACEEDFSMVATAEFKSEPTVHDVALKLCQLMEDPDDFEACLPQSLLIVNVEHLAVFQKYFEPLDINVAIYERAADLHRLSAVAFTGQELPDTPLTEVPVFDDRVWEVDWRRVNTWVESKSGELVQPWVIMVVDSEDGMILQTAMETEEPTTEFLGRLLSKAVLLPIGGDPHRPGKLVVKSGDSRIMINDWLKAADVNCEIGELSTFDDIHDSMNEDLFSDTRKGLCELEGVTPDMMSDLYEVAARYFQAAPWKRMRADDCIRITCPELSKRSWHVIGMGQNGEGLGFMLFENEQSIRSMFSSEPDLAGFQGISMTLEEKHLVGPADIAAADQFGWPVATAESWPMVARINGMKGFSDPDSDDLLLVIAAAKVMLEFWKSPSEARKRGNQAFEFPIQVVDRTVVVTASVFIL